MSVSTGAGVSPGPMCSFSSCVRFAMMTRKRILIGVLLGPDGELGHRGDVVADAGDVLAGLLKGRLDDAPNRRGAGKGMFPMLLDGIDLAQVDEDAVLDGLLAGVGVNDLTERIVLSHVSCRSARGACVTSRDLIAYCRLAIFASHPKVKALGEAPRQCPAQRDQRRGKRNVCARWRSRSDTTLTGCKHGETSGWQSLEEFG
jgi:hypothetical protein